MRPERDRSSQQEVRLTWLGREDDRGAVLDVIAVETFDPREGEVVTLVIHVIPKNLSPTLADTPRLID